MKRCASERQQPAWPEAAMLRRRNHQDWNEILTARKNGLQENWEKTKQETEQQKYNSFVQQQIQFKYIQAYLLQLNIYKPGLN